MKPFKGKKIILAITPDVKLYSCFEDNLKYLGFTIFTISFYKKFKYKNLKSRLTNIYRKLFFNDKSYKRSLVRIQNNIEVTNQISKTPKADYSLTIRADLFDEKTLKKITLLGNKNYAYQWDGFSRFPDIKKLIPLFNKFYVFDKNDLIEKTHPTTNFYFDCYDYLFKRENIEFDFYFIGNYDSRVNTVISIFEILHVKGYKLKLILYSKPRKHLKKYTYITFIEKPLSYYENLEHVANSKVLIDVSNNTIHSGLSFRTFEALGYNKKLITTNSNILIYDFYNKNNIFYLTENYDTNLIDSFLETPFQEINPLIKKKYSFTNWINYILEIKGNTSIEIP
jgi:hypothetical protein